MINFDTNKLIIACYPSGAGGKFLINCLGLADNAVFQDANLAEQQLSGKFTQTDKFNLLESRMKQATTSWRDLNLGCEQLFGFNNNHYSTWYPELLQIPERYNSIIKLLSNSDYYFFKVAHNFVHLNAYLKFWNHSNIIIFENYRKFIINRTHREANPPLYLTDVGSIDNLINDHRGFYLQLNMFDIHDCEIEKFKAKHDNFIMWNTNWYYSVDETVNNVNQLYKNFNLTNFNPDIVRNYFILWKNKLEELKAITNK